jgi:hypothetical protein
MAEAIAILALCVSLFLLVVHYTNQRERRHGEITQLRSDYLIRLSIVQQQITSDLLHAESVRSAMRTMRDSSDKYESIEQMPHLIQDIKDAAKALEKVIGAIEEIDSRIMNTSKALIMLQSMSHTVKLVENNMINTERSMFTMIEIIRSQQIDGVSGTKA